MSQRKAKEYRRVMDQYHGIAADVDDLKRRIGAMEARHHREDKAVESAKRRRRNERRRRELARRRIITMACAVVLLLAIVLAVSTVCTAQENEPEKEAETGAPVVFVPTTIGEDPLEEEKIEAALVAQGYFRDDVPLSYELQDMLHSACEENGIPYHVALGLIETESGFDPEAVSSSGCYGLCQLNPEYFPSDLTPAENITTGIEFLAYQLDRYDGDMEAALTAYNAGHDTGARWYAETVLEKAEKWRVGE